ncbi:MAG: cytochrome c family protein [Hyphomicrobiaceae bacterium]
MTVVRNLRISRLWWALAVLFYATAAAAGSKSGIVGPNACAECHTEETRIWKGTHHHKTFRKMPRSKEARKIAKKLKIRRVKSATLCGGCHFTEEKVANKRRVTAGISCESCHGAAQNWIKVHSEFSGKGKKSAESKSEAATRWKTAEKRGMIRPRALYDLAKNCYGCHVVPREKLVNVGGHPAGSAFNLVSWSQGEIRHNTWYSKGKSNAVADRKRQRMMYVVGLAVEIETALRAVGEATKPAAYAIRMAHRANDARGKMAAVVKAASNVPELKTILTLSHSAGLKLNNKPALTKVSDKIAEKVRQLVAKYDGTKLAAVDPLIPGSDKFRGKPEKKQK